MKLKISLFKKGLVISDLKRYWWVSALYTLVLLFIMPFNHFIQKFNSTEAIENGEIVGWLKESISNELSFMLGGISQYLLLVIPIIIGVLVFRFMQKGKSASLYHSLPLTRTALYVTSSISAFILLVAPMLVTVIVMLLLNGFSFLSAYYTFGLIMKWFGLSVLFGTLFLAMTIFVSMFTGSSVASIAFVYILNFLPMFLAEFIEINLRYILYGFHTYSNLIFYEKMPMTVLEGGLYRHGVTSHDSSNVLLIIYILVTIALLVGGLFAFKFRRPETAGDIVTFRPVKPIFIYGVTICATLLGGAYFLEIGNNTSLGFAIFGYFISSLVSYVIVQMVSNKSFKILHTYKGYIGYALVLLVLVLGVKFDVFGYVNNIPDPNDVVEAYVGQDIYYWQKNFSSEASKSTADPKSLSKNDIYKDKKNIESITKLHKMILDNRSISGYNQYVAYKLKNGKTIIREYVVDTELYSSALMPLYESSEYKNARFPILLQNVADIKYIEIEDSRAHKTPVVISDKDKLAAFKAAISKDIATLEYGELIEDYGMQACIRVNDSITKIVPYTIRQGYTNTINWLKSEGVYEQVFLQAAQVDYIVLEKVPKPDKKSSTQAADELKRVEIRDKKVIQELIDMTIACSYNSDASYYVSFYGVAALGDNSFRIDFDTVVSPELQKFIDSVK